MNRELLCRQVFDSEKFYRFVSLDNETIGWEYSLDWIEFIVVDIE